MQSNPTGDAPLPNSRFRPIARTVISGLISCSLVVAQAAPSFAAVPSGPITRADYEACQSADEGAFKSAIEALTAKSLAKALAGVDYKVLIANAWRKDNLDEILDKRVDQAMNEVKDETSWGGLLQSLASKDKAAELATAVADRVYKSEQIKTALEHLATSVGGEIGKAIELGTVDAGQPTAQCMRSFLGPRYGRTVAGAVASNTAKEFNIDPSQGSASVSTATVLAEGSEGMAGAMVLLVRRQLQNMASRIGQRIVGSLLSRLVGVVASGVGLVLIAKDIWDFRYGVLPIIATEMKSSETKEKVRGELAKSIEEQISEHAREISTRTADRVVDIWQEFRRAHAKVLELADREPSFRGFLDVQKPESLGRLDEMVAIVLASEGEAGVMRRLADGSLQQAVADLAPAAVEIAREARSLDTALRWSAIAGDDLPKIVEFDIQRRAKPEDFSKASLARILSLGDRLSTTRLAGIKRSARDVLLDLDNSELKALGRGLTEPELETLSGYLTGLDKQAGQRVLRAVAQNPAKMVALAPERVRNAILTSRDQAAAVSMMLRSTAAIDPGSALQDFEDAWNRRINPLLLWEKHPEVVGLLGLLAVIVLLLLRRLLFGSRRHRLPASMGGR